MTVNIWFEPHSTSVDNEAKLASGWRDVELSELGNRQSEELFERSRHRELDAIFTSDLQRAYKSAIPTASGLHIPVYIDRRLRECDYGQFDGKPKGEIDAMKPDHINQPFLDGESYVQCMKRMAGFLDQLKKNFDGRTVMIIGHRATQYGLEHHINDKSIKACVTESWSWQPGWQYELN